MRLVGVGVALSVAAAVGAYTSPPVTVSVEAAFEGAPLITQYLETVALEAPNELFPFISHLTTTPSTFRSLRNPLKPASYAAAVHYEKVGTNPVFAPEGALRSNETLALIDYAAMRSLLFRARGLRESIALSLATREASVRIEGTRVVWEQREKEVEEWEKERWTVVDGVRSHERSQLDAGETCESWVDVGGRKACSEREFWAVVGTEQQQEKTPIKLPSSLPASERPTLFPFDHTSPPSSSPHLPRVVLYGNPSSPSFQTLFSFLYQLSAPKPVPITSGKTTTSSTTKPALMTSKDLAAPHPPRLQFVLRWKPSTVKPSSSKLVLTGYGASLDLKKTDYLVIDDRQTPVEAGAGGEAEGNAGGGARPSERLLQIEGDVAPKMEPVKQSEVPELSLRTAQFILNSKEPFKAFTSLTSAFPRLASHLSTLIPTPSEHLLSEASMNQMSSALTLRPHFFLNGIAIAEADVDPYALIRLMRKERKLLGDLVGLSSFFTGKDARSILIDGSPKSKPASRNGLIDAEALGELYDSTDRVEGTGQVILWWNDLEKDRRYKSWSKSTRDLLRPTYPGSMHQIARNLNNVVFVLDLTQPNSMALITNSVKQFIARGVPVRFGLVPIISEEGVDEAAEAHIAQVLWYLVDAVGRSPAMTFLEKLALAAGESSISEPLLREAYTALADSAQHIDGGALATYDEIQNGIGKKTSSIFSRLSKTRDYLRRLSLPLISAEQKTKTSLGSFLMNGAFFPIDEQFTQNLQQSLALHTQFLAQEAYTGSLTEDVDVKYYFADLPSTHRRRNPWIYASEEKPLQFVNMVDAYNGINPKFVNDFYGEGTSGKINESTGVEIDAPPAVATLTIVTDLNEPGGSQLVRAALKLADEDTRVRVSFVHNPVENYETHPWALSSIFYLMHHYRAFSDILPIEWINWIDLELRSGGPLPRHGKDWSSENPLRPALNSGAGEKEVIEAQMFWDEIAWFRHKLGFKEGETGIVINGRVVGPFPEGSFEYADLQALLDYEVEKRIERVAAAVNATSIDFDILNRYQHSQLINLASSIVGVASLPDPTAGGFGGGAMERRRDYLALGSHHSAALDDSEVGAFFEVAVVVDPATELAQRWAPIIETLSSLTFVHVRLYLNPTFTVEEIPIKRFYEYSFHPALEFDEKTGKEVQPKIRFDNIPEDVLLTFAADTQKSWLAFPKLSVHDLDNIRLADLSPWQKVKGIEAVLELEALVVEGHAREVPTNKPPRGLQVELRQAGETEASQNTIVMANLGYLQLQANPGPWHFGIRAGRSSQVYELESVGVGGWKSADVAETGDALFVSTFEGLTLYPRFRRKPGHELTELLDESAVPAQASSTGGESFVDRIKNMIPFFAPSTPNAIVPIAKQADINVFTVASGLLYERMAFLMMVSVMRHTKSTVKFWFIANFLSPSFRTFIPHLAQEYGFDYELVTFKWPHWLRPQKEKQRTIWGYKILFLDVLFPLELERVIFVDSDQIVRTDLKELIDLDIKGAPYAYTPMGEDPTRPELEGFRFWKTGYWKNHLKGKPYHISALYLVDLVRFRQIAAGDRLRQQYQGLSADPASLSNLDQDLPNNVQDSIPIFSLDKSWLWCETWCPLEDLPTAKNLCNNPLTKEEKLKRGKRLIPEWTVYDDEVAALARRVAGDSTSAFATKADDSQQAQQQKKEREAEEEKKERAGEKEEIDAAASAGEEGRVKDEL